MSKTAPSKLYSSILSQIIQYCTPWISNTLKYRIQSLVLPCVAQVFPRISNAFPNALANANAMTAFKVSQMHMYTTYKYHDREENMTAPYVDVKMLPSVRRS